MAETLIQFETAILAPDGTPYRACACGSSMADGLWQGWIEFTPVGGGPTFRSGRETTQPNRADMVYWATGLSPVYLDGALRRALEGPIRVPVVEVERPVFDEPEPSLVTVRAGTESTAHAVLDPFSVFQKGEALLRRQLGALSSWHLVNIIIEYELSTASVAALNTMPRAALIDTIVTAVRGEITAAGRDSTS